VQRGSALPGARVRRVLPASCFGAPTAEALATLSAPSRSDHSRDPSRPISREATTTNLRARTKASRDDGYAGTAPAAKVNARIPPTGPGRPPLTLAVDGWVTIPPPPALRWDHDVDHENARKWITLKAPLKHPAPSVLAAESVDDGVSRESDPFVTRAGEHADSATLTAPGQQRRDCRLIERIVPHPLSSSWAALSKDEHRRMDAQRPRELLGPFHADGRTTVLHGADGRLRDAARSREVRLAQLLKLAHCPQRLPGS